MSLLWQCTGFLERFYLMLGAAKPQILAYWANSWQKASYIRDQCLILIILRHGHKTLSIASALLKDLFTHKPQLRVLPSLFICLCRFFCRLLIQQFLVSFSLQLEVCVSYLIRIGISSIKYEGSLFLSVSCVQDHSSYIALDRSTDWI